MSSLNWIIQFSTFQIVFPSYYISKQNIQIFSLSLKTGFFVSFTLTSQHSFPMHSWMVFEHSITWYFIYSWLDQCIFVKSYFSFAHQVKQPWVLTEMLLFSSINKCEGLMHALPWDSIALAGTPFSQSLDINETN